MPVQFALQGLPIMRTARREAEIMKNAVRIAMAAALAMPGAPAVARYLQFDPIGLAGGLNGYVYVEATLCQWLIPRG